MKAREISGGLLVVVSSLLALACSKEKCYDHQICDYHAQFEPTNCELKCTVTPFFSPDHSIDAYLDLIHSATESIDIFTPGFNSWSRCTRFSKGTCNDMTDCTGCSPIDQLNEKFPVFRALLNAVNNGIEVRILTNNFTQPTCYGKVAPLDWLHLNGIQIRFYTTTTFMHSKFVMVDKGKKTSVSSVNFSYTSFNKNREAGVIIEDCSNSATDLYKKVFDYDWDNAMEYTTNQYYAIWDKVFIKSNRTYDESYNPPSPIAGAYVTPYETFKNVNVKRGYTSPDNARSTILADLQNVKYSLQISIYQITDVGLCRQTLDLFQRGVVVDVLVSRRSVSRYKEAQDCYKMLFAGGMAGHIKTGLAKFSYSHAKYWIIDNHEVHLSTGNWNPSDFPEGSTFPPSIHTGQSINRNLLVVMEDESVVDLFQTVFMNDWEAGDDWVPKYSS